MEDIKRKSVIHPDNLGFEEMAFFYMQASDKQIKMLEKLLKSGKLSKAKTLLEEVLGVTFQ